MPSLFYASNLLFVIFMTNIEEMSKWNKFPKVKVFTKEMYAEYGILAIQLPEGVEILEEKCFYWNRELGAVYISKSLKEIGKNVFGECPKAYFRIHPENPYFCTERGTLFNKDKTVLIRCAGLKTRYVVPSTVHTIAAGAFSGCSHLQTVVLPKGLRIIEDNAFDYCTLRELYLPETLLSIGREAFYDAGSMNELRFPDSLKKVGEHAFAHCYGLKHVHFGQNLTLFSLSAFTRCDKISFTVDKENPKYTSKDGALLTKNKKTLLFAPSQPYIYAVPPFVEKIGDGAFSGFITPRVVKLHEGIKEIGYNAFDEALRTKFVIPKSVCKIGNRAFAICEDITHLTIPSGVKEIPQAMSLGCFSLHKLIIEEGVEVIGSRAFWDCASLRVILLPSTIKRIEAYAFADGVNLKAVIFSGLPPSIAPSAFNKKDGACQKEDSEKYLIIGYYPEKYADAWQDLIRKGRWKKFLMYPYSGNAKTLYNKLIKRKNDE